LQDFPARTPEETGKSKGYYWGILIILILMKITNWESIPKFLEGLRKEYRVIAPVDERGRINFKRIDSGSDVIPEFQNTRKSLKEFFLNSCNFFSDDNYLEDIKNLKFEINGKSLIFGVRACDLNALSLLDWVYFEGILSPSYERNRRRTVIIGMNCTEPGRNCFCTTFRTGPSIGRGADLVFTDLGNLYLVEVLSNGGKQILDKFPNLFLDAKAEHRKRKDRLMREAEERIKSLNMRGVRKKLESIPDKYWNKLDKECIGCYSCDIACPTVYSFEHALELKRPINRVYHKLNHFMDNYGKFGCVGCGRCIETCPRGIGMPDVLEDIKGLQ